MPLMRNGGPALQCHKRQTRKPKVSYSQPSKLINNLEKDLPILSFENVKVLHNWLEANHATSKGIFVRVYKKNSGINSVSFEELLDEGLCFGWSESIRLRGNNTSFLQKFTPRKVKGTTSKRNLQHMARLVQEGRMKPAGLRAIDIT